MKYTEGFSTAQWQWLLARYAEGYRLQELADWLGLHPRTVSRHWDELGLRTLIREDLTPLHERRQEFEVLGWNEER